MKNKVMIKTKELEESQKKWKFALDGQGGFWDWNLLTDECFYSKMWKKILGFEEKEFENTIMEWEKIVHPDDIKEVNSSINACINGENEIYISEHRVKKKNGSYVWILDRGKIMEWNKEGKPKRMIGSTTDITNIKKTHKLLMQSQKMETVGNLAGGLAHDFNNILTGIIGSLSLLKLELEDNNANRDTINEFLSTIEQSSYRAKNMVDRLLSLSKKKEMNFIPIDLNDQIKSTIQICKDSFSKSIEIIPTFFPKDAIINGDSIQIEQILLNICINASESMTTMRKLDEPIGGKLFISLEKLYTDSIFCKTHPMAKEGWYYIIRVKDTGVGIKHKYLSKIFDPFFTTKEQIKGTGLGLSMAYYIAKQHSGFIDVYSEYGVGSTFILYFPTIKEKGKGKLNEKKIDKRKKIIPRGSGLILIIDDEEIIRSLASRILKKAGYNLLVANNGKEGIEKYKKNQEKVECILLDMSMPVMSGKKTYIKLKEINPNVKIILSSGFKQDQRVQDLFGKGLKYFIEKPYNLYQLALKVKECLQD